MSWRRRFCHMRTKSSAASGSICWNCRWRRGAARWPGALRWSGCDAPRSRRLGLLRSYRPVARRCAVARYNAARLERPRRRRSAPAAVFPTTAHSPNSMLVPTESAIGIGAIDTSRRRVMVRAGDDAGAVWRFARREPAGGRDCSGQRRHRQFRQRRGGGSTRDGRGLRRGARTQRGGARRPGAALRTTAANRPAVRERGRRPAADAGGGPWSNRLCAGYPAAVGWHDSGASRRL